MTNMKSIFVHDCRLLMYNACAAAFDWVVGNDRMNACRWIVRFEKVLVEDAFIMNTLGSWYEK